MLAGVMHRAATYLVISPAVALLIVSLVRICIVDAISKYFDIALAEQKATD